VESVYPVKITGKGDIKKKQKKSAFPKKGRPVLGGNRGVYDKGGMTGWKKMQAPKEINTILFPRLV